MFDRIALSPVMLRDEGYDVLAAEGAERAFETSRDAATPPQTILGSGPDLMTADTASSSTIRATKPDAFDCITEPFDFDQLLVGAPGA
jgi:hypothetical protein